MEHPVLMFFGVFAVGVLVVWIKSIFDEKKGIDSPEKRKIEEILQKIMQENKEFGEYVSVYAYQREDHARSSRCWYYAIALTAEKMYVVPLTFGDKEIGHAKAVVIEKDWVDKIDTGKPGGPIYFIKCTDSNGKVILDFRLEEKNTKLDKTYPVNIVQVEEARAFMQILEQWKQK
ncbi:MAG: hypothetical protein HFI44_13975 [Lachnospiraceae bacterium]|nr:hypothetical protein [Lachnospiraceae bacterium]